MDPLTRGTLCIETSRLSTCFTLFSEMRPNDLYKWCETSLIQKIDTPRASVSSWTWYSACVPVVLADFVLKEDLRVFRITNYHLFSDLWAHCHILSLGHTATQRNLEAEGLKGDRWPTCAMLGINILVSGEGSVELLLVTALTSWNGQNDEMMRASFQMFLTPQAMILVTWVCGRVEMVSCTGLRWRKLDCGSKIGPILGPWRCTSCKKWSSHEVFLWWHKFRNRGKCIRWR